MERPGSPERHGSNAEAWAASTILGARRGQTLNDTEEHHTVPEAADNPRTAAQEADIHPAEVAAADILPAGRIAVGADAAAAAEAARADHTATVRIDSGVGSSGSEAGSSESGRGVVWATGTGLEAGTPRSVVDTPD